MPTLPPLPPPPKGVVQGPAHRPMACVTTRNHVSLSLWGARFKKVSQGDLSTMPEPPPARFGGPMQCLVVITWQPQPYALR